MDMLCGDVGLFAFISVVGFGYLICEVLSHGHFSDGVVVRDSAVSRTIARGIMLSVAVLVQVVSPSLPLLGLASGFVGVGMVICLSVKAKQCGLEQCAYVSGSMFCVAVFILAFLKCEACLAAALR